MCRYQNHSLKIYEEKNCREPRNRPTQACLPDFLTKVQKQFSVRIVFSVNGAQVVGYMQAKNKPRPKLF